MSKIICRENLIDCYNMIFEKYNLENPSNAKQISKIIRKSLQGFLQDKNNPALYCGGGHTKMMMADYIFELKKVRYIVDNYAKTDNDGGYIYIKDNEIREAKIDAIIISTYKFRKEITKKLMEEHSQIPFLDIYEILEENGIHLEADYYYSNHPFQHYHTINSIKRKLAVAEKEGKSQLFRQLVTKFLHIKDFGNARVCAREWYDASQKKEVIDLINDIDDLYRLEMKAIQNVSSENVLMLCIDGLRRRDLFCGGMPKLEKSIREQAFSYKNAYSFSTSTYESLIPVYSENSNLKTEYYKQNLIDESCCRFIKEAIDQDRDIFFYTDMDHFVESKKIRYSDTFQTACEKIWNFLVDAVDVEKGLFYIHILYESHYSFSNPYTKEALLSEGTAMLFDYLPVKGGKLRADYVQQHKDALCYLDDIITPFFKDLSCSVLLYSDHGNIILENGTKGEDLKETKLTFDEEWIQIPIVLKAPYIKMGKSEKLVSLMSLNDIVISLLNKESIKDFGREYIKIARSTLYNPDFRYLYEIWDRKKCLQAFEGFSFNHSGKLLIYEDATIELYDKNDEKIEDADEISNLLNVVFDDITVTKL